MFLHHNKDAFEELIVATATNLSIDSVIVEKDYYVSLALKLLNAKYPDIVFRGGTSLSKCFGLIERFSEDIDISVDASSGKMTESRKRALKSAITETIAELGLEIFNLRETHSRRDYNRYIARYDSMYAQVIAVKSELVIETFVAAQPFPTLEKNVNNYIYQFLSLENQDALAANYDLLPFKMKVQDLRRTFIDKVFALCDYYLTDDIDKHSRHIYDLYQIWGEIDFDDAFKTLVREVRAVRSSVSICPSAKDGQNVGSILQEMIQSDCYKSDYLQITEKLLFKPVPYYKAKAVLTAIVALHIF
ncbi:MAG: nucleotidyl transferase AbiEii/AbiGii toxin family protein [Ruthenibacterium sp.]